MELLTAKNIADMVKIHIKTVWKWVEQGKLPAPDIQRGPKFTRWYRETIENWIKAGCEAELHEAAH